MAEVQTQAVTQWELGESVRSPAPLAVGTHEMG